MTATLAAPQNPASGPPGEDIHHRQRNAMRTVAVRGLRAHKGRFFLTLLSVVLGTAFVCGSYVFTDTMRSSFNSVVDGSLANIDVQVIGDGDASPGVPLSYVEQLRSVDGVYAVEPATEGPVSLIGSDGKAIASGGAPVSGFAWNEGRNSTSATAGIVEGRAPRAENEIVLNTSAAEKAELQVGDDTKVLLPKAGLVPVTLVGTYDVDFSVGGFVGVALTPERAMAEFTDGTYVSSIGVRAADDSGLTESQLLERVKADGLPDGVTAQTGEQTREEEKTQIADAMNFVTTLFMVFASIALVVGSFIIANTFSMVVAQRLRELALLRALGASRRQVSRSVLVEGVIVGLTGSLMGLALGFGLAMGLLTLINNMFGSSLPLDDVRITPAGTLATLGVGLVVTLVAAYGPARRAARTAPVEAMRGEFATPRLSVWRRLVPGLALLAAGIGLTAYSMNQESLQLLGVGGLLVLFSVLMISPFIAPTVMGVFRPLTRWGPVGRLAQGNANRNPKRTTATAFAIALGLALITGFALLGASMRATFNDVLENGQKWDYTVRNSQNEPLAPNVVTTVEQIDGVESVVGFGTVQLTTQEEPEKAQLALPVNGRVSDSFALEMVAGKEEVTADTFLITKAVADKRGWSLGQEVTFVAQGAEPITLRVGGIMKTGQSLDPAVVPWQATSLSPPDRRDPTTLMIQLAPDADRAAVRDAIEKATENYPLVNTQDRDEFTEGGNQQINTVLNVMYGLLALAIVISILGLVNTLSLSVVERRREVGMLRAMGTLRSQVRRMITVESILIATYGALIGLTIGPVYGWLFVGQLADEGLTHRTIPWGQYGIFVVTAVVIGAMAALWPAFKASRTRPLEALADD